MIYLSRIENVPYHLSVFDEENCESRERKLRYYYYCSIIF